jgi:hypothetical protein
MLEIIIDQQGHIRVQSNNSKLQEAFEKILAPPATNEAESIPQVYGSN